jgi:hypothetical protein
MSTSQKLMMTQSALGRALDCSPPRLAKLVQSGTIKPDNVVAGKIKLFDSSRLETIRKIINLSKGTAVIC